MIICKYPSTNLVYVEDLDVQWIYGQVACVYSSIVIKIIVCCFYDHLIGNLDKLLS